jgi:hypothetical protein
VSDSGLDAQSAQWLLERCEHYMGRAHDAERLISRMRGQWIHSVHADECLALLAGVLDERDLSFTSAHQAGQNAAASPVPAPELARHVVPASGLHTATQG